MVTTISVLMSIYNESEKQIRESIESILRQSYQGFEFIIVCDNPSREKEVELILDTYQDRRIVLLQNEKNIGLAMSMNRAAEVAKSDVFARMDADDIANETRLEEEYKALIDNKVDVVFTNFTYIDEQSSDIKDKRHSFPSSLNGMVPSKDIALRPNLIHHPTVMMRREMFEKVGGYRDFPCAQDSDLWMRMQESGAIFYLLKKTLLKYRINSEGTTQKRYFKQQLTMHYIYSLSIERLVSGQDSFSQRNYDNYLIRCGIYSKSKENHFLNALGLLRKSMNKGPIAKWFYRFLVFVTSPQHRKFFLMKNKKKRLLNDSIRC